MTSKDIQRQMDEIVKVERDKIQAEREMFIKSLHEATGGKPIIIRGPIEPPPLPEVAHG